MPHPEAARLGGLLSVAHFAAAGIEDVDADSHFLLGIAPPYNPDGSLHVAFSELLHVRRSVLPYDGLLRAVALVPDAVTTLSASAAALAAARTTSVGQQWHVQTLSEMKPSGPSAETQPVSAEGAYVVATGACAAASVPAAPQRSTRTAVRGGGMAAALARMRREAAEPAALC